MHSKTQPAAASSSDERPLLAADDATFSAWNEEMARRFDPEAFHHHPNPLIRWVEGQRVRAARRLLALRPHFSLLEVGCGPGDLLLALPPGARRVGLDLSSSLLRRARQRLGAFASFLQGDAERLPLANASFDRVLCSEVLEHVRHPERVLQEIARVLRPGGLAVVSVPEERSIDRVKELLWRSRLDRWILGAKAQPGPDAAAGYQVERRMTDAWHLHDFSLELLLRLAPPELQLEQVRSVPSRLLPLRRVVAFRRRA